MLAAAAALVALAGGAAAVLVAGSDDDGDSPLAVATAPERSDSTPAAPPEPPGAPTVSEAESEDLEPAAQPTETTSAGAHKTRFPRERRQRRNDPPRRKFAIPPAREFSGTGNASLGTVDLRRPAVVKWSTKGRFELRFGREAFPIIAPSASGRLIVPPDAFEMVRVIARGRWKISITPQK